MHMPNTFYIFVGGVLYLSSDNAVQNCVLEGDVDCLKITSTESYDFLFRLLRNLDSNNCTTSNHSLKYDRINFILLSISRNTKKVK